MTNRTPTTVWSILRRSVRFWFGLLFLIAALGMIPVVLAEKQTYEAVVAKGHTTVATVLEHGETTDHDDKRSHWVRLQYRDLASKEHTEDLAVSSKLYDSLQIGSLVGVRFLREHPETVMLETTLPDPEWKDARALTLTFAVIGMMIVGLSFVRAERAMRRLPQAAAPLEPSLVGSDRLG